MLAGINTCSTGDAFFLIDFDNISSVSFNGYIRTKTRAGAYATITAHALFVGSNKSHNHFSLNTYESYILLAL